MMLRTILEMTKIEGLSQSTCDRLLRFLTNSGGKMERSRLRRCAGIKLAELDIHLGELAREYKIMISGEAIIINILNPYFKFQGQRVFGD